MEAKLFHPQLHQVKFLVDIISGDMTEQQISLQQEKLKKELRLKLRIAGVANSRKMIFDREGLEPMKIKELLDDSNEKSDLTKFCQIMTEMNMFNSVFVDCTADQSVANHYQSVLSNYISIVAANNSAASSAIGEVIL